VISPYRSKTLLGIVVGLLAVVYGCAPQRPYRAPAPPSSSMPLSRSPQTTAPIPPPPPTPEADRKPVPQESKIREQDIRSKPSPTVPPARETIEPGRQASPGESRTPDSTVFQPTTPPLPDDSSLVAKITAAVTPQRAVSLRLTEEGRKLLDAGDTAKALTRLEKTIAIDSSNPYGYFYLAKAQNRLGRYKDSLNFLEVAESRLSGEPFWLAEVHALRGDNYRALGQPQRAETSYVQSLRLNSGNRAAADALLRLQADAPSPAK